MRVELDKLRADLYNDDGTKMELSISRLSFDISAGKIPVMKLEVELLSSAVIVIHDLDLMEATQWPIKVRSLT